MDPCAQPELLSVANAIAQMLACLQPIADTETLALEAALDRVLAQPLYAPINVPGYPSSAMDGYALRHADASCGLPLRIAGASLAGRPFVGEMAPGECVRIMTGALLPTHADCVVMQEQVRRVAGEIFVERVPQLHENIRPTGEDIARGCLVLEPGKRIAPLDIGLLAALGIAEVCVFQRLRIGVLGTGDELKPAGQPLGAGEIYDSNRPTLIALLSRLNVEVIDFGLLADDPQAIARGLQGAMGQTHALITSGGVSVGDADFTRTALEALGQIHFWKLAMKPGKPFAFGTLGTPGAANACWFFGLPGNPVSACVTFHQLVVPALRHLAGEILPAPLSFTCTSQSDLKKQPGRADYQRGLMCHSQGQNQVRSSGNQSSGVLSSLAKADCYILIDQDQGSVAKGEAVTVIPFDKFLL